MVLKVKYLQKKKAQGKGRPSDLVCVVLVPEVSDRKRRKILTPKQILQRLRTALAQVNDGNSYENLLNEIRRIIYPLY